MPRSFNPDQLPTKSYASPPAAVPPAGPEPAPPPASTPAGGGSAGEPGGPGEAAGGTGSVGGYGEHLPAAFGPTEFTEHDGPPGRPAPRRRSPGEEAEEPPATAAITPVRTFATNQEGVQYGTEVWGDLFEGPLTEPQMEAVRAYTASSSEINGYLRADDDPAGNSQVAALDQALAMRPAPEAIRVHRGTGPQAFDRHPAELEGTVQRDRAYLSTSIGAGPKGSFASEGVVLHLDVPAGTPALYVGTHGSFGHEEREVLLGRGLPYRIGRVESIDGTWHVHGTFLAPGETP